VNRFLLNGYVTKKFPRRQFTGGSCRAAQSRFAAGKNAIDRILHLIEEAEERRAPLERFLDKFSRIYTPVIMLMSVLVILIPPLAFCSTLGKHGFIEV